MVIRKDYFRIFKFKKEINDIKNDDNYNDKMNFMTIDEYKKKYIINENFIKKGIYINSDKDNFKNDEKIVRNLPQISFRILNYILFSNLFFVRLITNKKDDFEKYLPQGMNWAETLSECWNILKNELLKINIDSIEKFISYLFSDLFPILNNKNKINNFKNLIVFVDEFNSKIEDIIEKYKEVNENHQLKNRNEEDKNSCIALLKEIYTEKDYPKKDYPFYQYFYYTDYLDERYINEKLSHMKETKYPVLKNYLESKNNRTEDINYSLNDLNLFNTVLNLIDENYYNKVSIEYAEKTEIKDEEIYKQNMQLINKFIDFINHFKFDRVPKLSINNHISDFLIIENIFFNTYKKIYKEFTKKQNEKLKNLLDIKANMGIFDLNCKNKIHIQQIKENEIFNLKLPKNISFIDIIFNSFYRKIVDSRFRSKESYKEYEINYDLIEENMTELLLKNKKLLIEDINEFVYNDEMFENQITNLISSFAKNFKANEIDRYDKFNIYKCYREKRNSKDACKNIINDFLKLIQLKNDRVEDTNNNIINITNNNNDKIVITLKTPIYEIINKLKEENNYSDDFIKIFENNKNLTFDKTLDILLYYLKLVFEIIKDDLRSYHNEINKESKEYIKKYYEKEKDLLIKQKDFASAIRLFTKFVLFLENDKNKEKKIKKIVIT